MAWKAVMILRANEQPVAWSTFPRKAEEPKQGTTEVLNQIALSSGVVWIPYRYLPYAIVTNTRLSMTNACQQAG
jgi:hypothetical protein